MLNRYVYVERRIADGLPDDVVQEHDEISISSIEFAGDEFQAYVEEELTTKLTLFQQIINMATGKSTCRSKLMDGSDQFSKWTGGQDITWLVRPDKCGPA